MQDRLKFFKIFLFALSLGFTLTACESFQTVNEAKTLEGPDVSTYSLALGAVEFRLKVSGLTSSLWITTELINKSNRVLIYTTRDLLQFEDASCLEDQRFESRETGTLKPNERQIIRYTFRLYAAQKYSPEYERCKAQPLRFKIGGLSLGGEVVAPLSFTIQN